MQVVFRCELNTDPHTELWERWVLILIVYILSKELPKWADQASLLTACSMLLHAFPSMFVSPLREFPEAVLTNMVDETVLLNIYWYDIESAKNAFIGLAH